MDRFCKSCGAPRKEGDMVCPYCQTLFEDEVKSTQTPPAPQPINITINGVPQDHAQPQQPDPRGFESENVVNRGNSIALKIKKAFKTIFLVIAIACITFVVIGIIAVSSASNDDSPGNSVLSTTVASSAGIIDSTN